MLRQSFLLLLLLLSACVAQAGWREGGAELRDDTWRRSDGAFDAMLVITDQIESFLEAWSKPSTPGYAPAIRTTRLTARGGIVTAVVLFSGCAPGEDGNCRCKADLKVLRPDGSTYAAHRGVPVWDWAPPPPGHLQLSNGRLRMRVEEGDPIGSYSIKALVSDLVAKRQVSLEWKIEVVTKKPD